MNILVTGALGSGGSYLCEYILEHNPEYKIWAPVRWHSTSQFKNIEKIRDSLIIRECDLNDFSSVVRVLQDCVPDKIFNLAATANVAVAFKTPLAVLQNNIFSTANLLEAVRLVCPQTIFNQCSTSEVCGTPVSIPMTEEHQLNPSNPYAVSKLAAEKLTQAYHVSWGLKVIITRAFCYINPRRSDLFATSFARQIAKIEQGKQDFLYHGNLDSIRTVIDVRDVMRAYLIASNKCLFGRPYNIGGELPVSVGEILYMLKSRAKVKIVSKLDETLLRPSDITNQVPDVTAFRHQTQFKPQYSLSDSLEWLLNCCREDVKNEG